MATSNPSGSSRPARSAHVNANRSTRSNPRPVNRPERTARSNTAASRRPGRHRRRITDPGTCAFTDHPDPDHRAAARARAAATRTAITADPSATSPTCVNAAALNGGTSTRISTRSHNGPDNRPKYRRRTNDGQQQSTSRAAAHGHGFAANTN